VSGRIEWTGNIQVHHEDKGQGSDAQQDLMDYLFSGKDS
jgi:hypothetical protein